MDGSLMNLSTTSSSKHSYPHANLLISKQTRFFGGRKQEPVVEYLYQLKNEQDTEASVCDQGQALNELSIDFPMRKTYCWNFSLDRENCLAETNRLSDVQYPLADSNKVLMIRERPTSLSQPHSKHVKISRDRYDGVVLRETQMNVSNSPVLESISYLNIFTFVMLLN